MPMSGTTYVAPTWRNTQGPAIDATELQAMCNTIAGNQAKNLSQDSLIAALQTAVGGKGQVEVGSYVGTGLYGADNPTTITCSFAPKLVWLYANYTSPSGGLAYSLFMNGAVPLIIPSIITTSYAANPPYAATGGSSQAYSSRVKKSSDEKTFSWYNSRADLQYNGSGNTYLWIAFR